MFELKTILVAIDFSEPSIEAVKTARRLAELFGGTLHVVHVVEQIAGYHNMRVTHQPVPPLLKALVDETAGELKSFIATHLGTLPEERVHLRIGRPYQEVARAVEESGADLVVLGTSGNSGMERIMLGSVAEKVITTSRVPVLSLRQVPRLEAGTKVLVATDLSASARRAAGIAETLANGIGGSLELMAVLEPPNRFAFWRMEPAEQLRQAEARLMGELKSFAEQCLRAGTPQRLRVRVGSVDGEIVKEAKELPADLLVMGVVGHSGVTGWLMGGVTERVLHACPVAMLTVRAS